MTLAIKIISFFIAITIWAILGLYLWIPTMVLIMILFVTSTIASTILWENEFVAFANTLLEKTSPIYHEGFINIFESIWVPNSNVYDIGNVGMVLIKVIFFGGIWLFLTTLFWALVINIVRYSNLFGHF